MTTTRTGLRAAKIMLAATALMAGAYHAAAQSQMAPRLAAADRAALQSNGTGSADGARLVEGQKVPIAELTEFCRGQAATELQVGMESLSTLDPIERDGGIMVEGEVDTDDDDREFPFQCHFDKDGVYLGFSR